LFEDICPIRSRDLGGNQAKEHGEIERSRRLAEHGLKLIVRIYSAQGIPSGNQVTFIDDAILVVVDEREGFLVLLKLGLTKLGKDI
jgi:hypothetical protein